MMLCEYCVAAMRSHGERVFMGSMIKDIDEAEEDNTPCEFCGEFDDLYECEI